LAGSLLVVAWFVAGDDAGVRWLVLLSVGVLR